ncbi:hypothetical protein Nepgr_024327 [Nepenthes gracilis]|uniref:Glycosyl transferase CAP10 domain-containing protein n=1 Tax=Nepenthes gracilis TaxID=150966 RepID=A0AAD3XZX7_NEPGR|nr:hypothetical protein Nepgr_024327 [Nepenthes gracilis]
MEKPAHRSRLRLSKPFSRALEVVRWPATLSSKVFSGRTASLMLLVVLVGTIASTRWIGVDWNKEIAEGFNNSDLSKQCTNRYRIYIEGIAWSVSNKYILACDSMTLLVNPNFYEFFTRGLVPLKHYWPISDHPDHICKSIKFAVNWGNSHVEKAQEIGQAGSKFIMEQMSIENIYDYMFHLLKEYGMLLRYKPTIPPRAVELCSEKWSCVPNGLEHMYRLESMVEGPAQRNPCAMPPPYSHHALQALLSPKCRIKRQVEEWESKGNQ